MDPIEFIQGDTLDLTVGPAGFVQPAEPLTPVIANVRVTVSEEGSVLAPVTEIATLAKFSENILAPLRGYMPSAGVRGRNARTGEYIVITAVSGGNATITRAAVDPGGTPGPVAAPMLTGDKFYLLPLDSVAATAIVDPSDATGRTAIVTIAAADTRIPVGSYDGLLVAFQDTPGATPTDRRTWRSSASPAVVVDGDNNLYGV